MGSCLHTTSAMEFSPMKIFGQKFYFHAWKLHFHAGYFHFMHAIFIFMHGNFISCLKMKFTCMTFSFHNFFMHETFRTGGDHVRRYLF